MSRYLRAFDDAEVTRVGRLLREQARILRLVRGHYEEYHWAAIYRAAKGLEPGGWSNLPFRDFISNGVGVEWKTLQKKDPVTQLGKRLMHPAASRRIRFDPNGSAKDAMKAVFEGWNRDIEEFRKRVSATSTRTADLRWGILLWDPSLASFVYWEERLEPARPDVLYAEWVEVNTRGATSKNLYIYDAKTKEKVFSVTAPRAGAKLQPYFRVPTRAEGAHVFEAPAGDHVPLWVSPGTLKRLALDDADDIDRRLSDILDAYDRRGRARP